MGRQKIMEARRFLSGGEACPALPLPLVEEFHGSRMPQGNFYQQHEHELLQCPIPVALRERGGSCVIPVHLYYEPGARKKAYYGCGKPVEDRVIAVHEIEFFRSVRLESQEHGPDQVD